MRCLFEAWYVFTKYNIFLKNIYPSYLGNQSEVEKDILLFIRQLKKSFPKVMVVRQDERFTSKMAFNSLIQIGAKKKTRKDKGVIDEISATLILQSYLTSNSKPVL